QSYQAELQSPTGQKANANIDHQGPEHKAEGELGDPGDEGGAKISAHGERSGNPEGCFHVDTLFVKCLDGGRQTDGWNQNRQARSGRFGRLKPTEPNQGRHQQYPSADPQRPADTANDQPNYDVENYDFHGDLQCYKE